MFLLSERFDGDLAVSTTSNSMDLIARMSHTASASGECRRSKKSMQTFTVALCAAWVLAASLPSANAVTTTTTISSTIILLTTSTIWIDPSAATGVVSNTDGDIQHTDNDRSDSKSEFAATQHGPEIVTSSATPLYTTQSPSGSSCNATKKYTPSMGAMPTSGSNATVPTANLSTPQQATQARTASSEATQISAYAVYGNVAAIVGLLAFYILLPTCSAEQCNTGNDALGRQGHEENVVDGQEHVMYTYCIDNDAEKDIENDLSLTAVMAGPHLDQRTRRSLSTIAGLKLQPAEGQANGTDFNSSWDSISLAAGSALASIWTCDSSEYMGSDKHDQQSLLQGIIAAKGFLAILVMLLYFTPLVTSQAVNSAVRTPAADPSLVVPPGFYQESTVDQQAVFNSSSVPISSVPITSISTETHYSTITVCYNDQTPKPTFALSATSAGNAAQSNTTTWATVSVTPVPAGNTSWSSPFSSGANPPQPMIAFDGIWMLMFGLVSMIMVLLSVVP